VYVYVSLIFIYIWVVFTYVCVCVYMCVCMYVFTFLSIYVCMYVYIGLCTMYVCTCDVTGTVRSPTFYYTPFLPSAADKPSIPLLGARCPLQLWCEPLLSAVRGRRYRSTLLIFISRQAVFVARFSLIVR